MKITLSIARFLGILTAILLFEVVAWSSSIILPYLQIKNQGLTAFVWSQLFWVYIPFSITGILLLLPFRRLHRLRTWAWAYGALVLCTVYIVTQALSPADLVLPGLLAIQLVVIYLQRFRASPGPGPAPSSHPSPA